MANIFDRLARLAALGERLAILTDNLKNLISKVEDHEKRLVRLETMIEIAKPNGVINSESGKNFMTQ
jgi:C4-dicarboxylate-specific signal transduction histidine kinase